MIEYSKVGRGYIVESPAMQPIAIKGRRFHGMYASLQEMGLLEVRPGYWWNGPNFPAIATKNSIEATLWHDLSYELIKRGVFWPEHREYIDKQMYNMLIEKGMNKYRAKLWYVAVRTFGHLYCKPGSPSKRRTYQA